MKRRIVTALVIVAVALPLLIFGHYKHIFTAALGILVFAGTYEMSRAAQGETSGVHYRSVLTSIGGFVLYVVFSAAYLSQHFRLIFIATAIVALCALFWYVADRSIDLAQFAKQFFVMVFVAATFAALSALYEQNTWLLLYPITIAIVTDMFAYFIGIPFGRHKLAPEVSPKKSIEGAVGGLVAATLLGLALLLANIFPSVPWYIFVPGAALLSVIGQLGDLIASKIKRDAGIKDFSNLLPGHGGVIDRFDSWMLTGFVFWLLWTVI